MADGEGSGSGSGKTCPNELLFQRGALFTSGQVIRVTLDDFMEHPFGNGTPTDVNGAYSPDGKRIALVRDGSNLWTMDLDGGNAHEVDSQNGFIATPAWSPDGTRLAYVVSPFSGDTTLRIYVADVTASSGTNITTTGEAELPVWNPNGTKILFSSNRTGNYDVWTMSPDGSNLSNLTNRAHDDGKDGAGWSPDGSQIVFTGFGAIWRMNADGTNAAQITNGTGGDGMGAWGVDGLIYYVNSPNDFGQLYVTNPNGANQHLVLATPDSDIDLDPVLSPDGKRIAYARRDNGTKFRIFVANADGTNPVRVTNTDSDDRHPVWAPCH